MLGGIAGSIGKVLKQLEKENHGHPAGGGGRRVLKKGMSGMDVARCQNLLNRELAFSPPPLWVDGIFGPITDRRVREFQMKKRLTVDGIVGGNTWAALEGKPVGMGGAMGGIAGGITKALGGINQGLGGIGGAIGKGFGGAIGKSLGGAIGSAGKSLK